MLYKGPFANHATAQPSVLFLVMMGGLLGSCSLVGLITVGLFIGYTRLVPFIGEFPINMIQLLCLVPFFLGGIGACMWCVSHVCGWFQDREGSSETAGMPWAKWIAWILVNGVLAISVMSMHSDAPQWSVSTIAILAVISAWAGAFLGALSPAYSAQVPYLRILWIAAMALTWSMAWVGLHVIFQRYPHLF